jgi:hypothetical protein
VLSVENNQRTECRGNVEQSVDQQRQNRMEMDQRVEHVPCVEVNVVACQLKTINAQRE